MNDAEPLLRLRGIGKSFGPVNALTDINLDVPAGQVTALVGDNGAGKSTLIKTISGIWEPTHGEMFWQGKHVNFHSPKDATLTGLDNVLSGFQCGTVYKPIYEEAQAAAALAIFVRDHQTPPSSLVNGTTKDTTSNTEVPSVLLKPEWVTNANMNSTVIADKFVPASQLCAGSFAADCKAAGISS